MDMAWSKINHIDPATPPVWYMFGISGANIKIGKNLRYHDNTGVVLPWLQRKKGIVCVWQNGRSKGHLWSYLGQYSYGPE